MFYVLIDGKEYGPFTAAELAEVQATAKVPYEVTSDDDDLLAKLIVGAL
jgi:hypothetical protein